MNERTSPPGRAPPDAASSAEIYEDVAMHAPAMLWMSDANGAMVFLNQRYLSFTGLTAAQAMRSDAWISAVHPDDRERAMSVYVEAFKRQAPFQVQYRLRRADGIHRHMLDIAAPRHDVAGRFRGYVGSTVDQI